jgi:hypothetical protein
MKNATLEGFPCGCLNASSGSSVSQYSSSQSLGRSTSKLDVPMVRICRVSSTHTDSSSWNVHGRPNMHAKSRSKLNSTLCVYERESGVHNSTVRDNTKTRAARVHRAPLASRCRTFSDVPQRPGQGVCRHQECSKHHAPRERSNHGDTSLAAGCCQLMGADADGRGTHAAELKIVQARGRKDGSLHDRDLTEPFPAI